MWTGDDPDLPNWTLLIKQCVISYSLQIEQCAVRVTLYYASRFRDLIVQCYHYQ